ncbi:hypothetical protein FRC07_003329, partial [Ceratobasidium sp. 392]
MSHGCYIGTRELDYGYHISTRRPTVNHAVLYRPIPQHTISPAGPSRSAQEAPGLAEGAEGEWPEGEDEVEAPILVEKEDEAATEHSNPSNKHAIRPPASRLSDDGDDLSSDSDSSSCSSVEIRVTRYPTSTQTKRTDSLTVVMKATDSDAEDEDGVLQGSSAQYSGTKNEILAPDVEVPEITEIPAGDVLEP